MASPKISLTFHKSSLSADDHKKVETTGMLILASDFIQSGKVNRANKLTRVSKISIPLILAKTKSGGYIAVNPFSSSTMNLTVTQLPPLTEIKAFCKEEKNLELNRLHNKIMKFTSLNLELTGVYSEKDLPVIKELLKAPRDSQTGFTKINPIRPMTEIKGDLTKINELVYDEKSLKKGIKDRLDLMQQAMLEHSKKYDESYDERKNYWANEIKQQQDQLTAKMADRDRQLKKDVKAKETSTEGIIKENLNNFLQGVAKNIRTDEKSIEKILQSLEKITSKAKSSNDVPEIERILNQLGDATETFRASVNFAKDQVRKSRSRERDIREMLDLDLEGLKQQSEIDKIQMKEDLETLEANRESELSKLAVHKDEAHTAYLSFQELRKEWTTEIEANMGTKTTAMLDASDLNVDTPGTNHELLIPVYIFQYQKESEHYTVVVPPIITPESMKKGNKNSFYGDKKTVFFDLIVPNSRELIAEWLEGEAKSRDMHALIQQVPNLLDNPSELRDVFFNSQSLMIDKLKVNKKEIKKANDRLTDVWTSA